MANFFGGKNPFDHPFFTQPFGGLFGGKSPFDDPFFPSLSDNHSGSRRQVEIEEMNPGDDGGNDAWRNDFPSKELSVPNSTKNPTTGVQNFTFQRVAYGGPEGIYYSSSVGKRTGGDGVFLMEMKEEDRAVGESLHTISKGIHEKGHSVTTKKCSDGRVDSVQTLHNLEEDELAGFEETWKTNADSVLPGWSNGFNLLQDTGSNSNTGDDFANWGGWPFPSLEYYGALPHWGGWPFPSLEYDGALPDGEPQDPPSREASRKIVPIE